MSNCHCGSSLPFEKCCLPIHQDIRLAKTASALMRARYSAYVVGNLDFLKESLDDKGRQEFDEQNAKEWSKKAQWQGLEIVETLAGEPDDQEGKVEFVARYEMEGEEQEHHEVGSFHKEKGAWRFVEGAMVSHDPYVREAPKVGRNDPCPCESGKKHKKCCGAK